MSRLICPLGLLMGLLTLASLSGCSQSGSGADAALVAKYRPLLTMADEPDGAQLIPEVRAALLGESEQHTEEEHAEHEQHEGEDHEEHAHDEHEGHDHAGHDHAGHEHAHEAVTKTTEAIEVVLVGKIGGLANPWQETQPDFPFATNQAAFFLSDPQAVVENEESGHSHAPGEECAFCEAHAADNSELLAMVRFVDEKGGVLRMDVRELFEVSANDTVVVRGSARVVAGGMMVVDATGLYVRR